MPLQAVRDVVAAVLKETAHSGQMTQSSPQVIRVSLIIVFVHLAEFSGTWCSNRLILTCVFRPCRVRVLLWPLCGNSVAVTVLWCGQHAVMPWCCWSVKAMQTCTSCSTVSRTCCPRQGTRMCLSAHCLGWRPRQERTQNCPTLF